MKKSPNQINNNDDGLYDSRWDTLSESKFETKASAGTIMEDYGDRVVFTAENGKESRIMLNPWAMEDTALERPENMLILGQTFQHMAKKWKNDEKNPSRKVYADGEESGWEDAIKTDSSSMLGEYISSQIDPKPKGKLEGTVANLGSLMEDYGERIIFTDENGKETRMTLNPIAMIESALDSPDDMNNVGTALKKMATRWHYDEKNPSRRVYEGGEESGWDNATKVDGSSALGRYIERTLEQQDKMF